MFKQRATGLTDRGNYALNIAGALKPGVSATAAESALNGVARQAGAAIIQPPIATRRCRSG